MFLICGFLVTAGVALTASAGRAETYTSLMVFGDSLSDVGNEHAVHGDVTPPYYNFRNSNGPLWVDDLPASMQQSVVSTVHCPPICRISKQPTPT